MTITTKNSGTRDDMSAAGLPTTHTLSLLDVCNVVVTCGGVVALDRVSFKIPEGKVVALIGPNGAGKTTLFNCVSRLYTPDSGDILYRGQSLLATAAQDIAVRGIGRTFQNLALFQNLTVTDNIRIGAHTRTRGNLISDALRLPLSRRANVTPNPAADRLIEYLPLQETAPSKVNDLPVGTQKPF